MTRNAMQKRDAAIATLRQILGPGDEIWSICRHASRSGMRRVYDLYLIRKNTPQRITGLVCEATGATYNRTYQGLQQDGAGKDAVLESLNRLCHVVFSADSPTPGAALIYQRL